MSIWIFLWLIVALIILGTTGWSLLILFQQKQAWKAYATKHKLTYKAGTTFGPSEVEGDINNYTVSLFSATQQKPDARKNRQVTVFQINTDKAFVDGIGAGTKEMVLFLETLEAITPYNVKVGEWNKDYHIRARNKKAVDAFMTEERVKILKAILAMPKSDVLILLDNNQGTFRFETSNPMQDLKMIENTIDKLMKLVDKLAPDEAEAKKLETLASQEREKTPRPEPVEEVPAAAGDVEAKEEKKD